MALFSMKSGNPALKQSKFEVLDYNAAYPGQVMTVGGTVNKTGILLALLMGVAYLTYTLAGSGAYGAILYPAVIGGLILALVFSLIIIFKPTTAPYLSPAYAIAEGLLLGAISAVYNNATAGAEGGSSNIVTLAIGLTFGVLLTVLVMYRTGALRATNTFKKVVIGATGGVVVVYLVSMIMNLFGFGYSPIHGAGMIGIGFSLVVVVIAALNLVLDFDFIEQSAAQGAPKYMEWYGAFSIMLTLVWLYLEILRLLSKLNRD